MLQGQLLLDLHQIRESTRCDQKVLRLFLLLTNGAQQAAGASNNFHELVLQFMSHNQHLDHACL